MLKGGTWERWAVELVLGYGVKAGVAAAVVLVVVGVAVALRAPMSQGAQKASWRIDLKKGVKGARREKFEKEYYKLD